MGGMGGGDAVDRYRPMANRSLFAKFEVRSSLRSDAIVITTDERTDVLEFRADQMSPRNIGSQFSMRRL